MPIRVFRIFLFVSEKTRICHLRTAASVWGSQGVRFKSVTFCYYKQLKLTQAPSTTNAVPLPLGGRLYAKPTPQGDGADNPCSCGLCSWAKKFKPYPFALDFAWWAATAISRLTVGAHYLTDVTIAGLATILAYAIVLVAKRIYEKKRIKDIK